MKPSPYRCVQLVLGLVLLAAALLKGRLLYLGEYSPDDWLSSPWMLWGALVFESHLAVWLFLGLYPRTTRYFVLIVFGVFAVLAYAQARSGVARCACLGGLASPWAALAIDLAACAALIGFVPSEAAVSRARSAQRRSLIRYAGTCAILLSSIVGFAAYSWSRGAYAAPLLVCSPSSVSFGNVEMSGRALARFTLRNDGTTPVRVSRIEAGCSCLDILLPRRTLEPGQELAAIARLDLAREPGFRGHLAVNAIGYTDSGQPAFRLTAKTDVEAPPYRAPSR